MKEGINYPNHKINTLLVVYPRLPKNSFAPCKFHIKASFKPPIWLESVVFRIHSFKAQNTLKHFQTPFTHLLLALVDFIQVYLITVIRSIKTFCNLALHGSIFVLSKLATYNLCTCSHQAIFWRCCRGAKRFWSLFLIFLIYYYYYTKVVY
jgi:hypothetical protein